MSVSFPFSERVFDSVTGGTYLGLPLRHIVCAVLHPMEHRFELRRQQFRI